MIRSNGDTVSPVPVGRTHENPAVHRVTLRSPEGHEVDLTVAENRTILDAATEAGLLLPAMCCQGWCLTCAGRLLEGEVDHALALRYYEADREAGYVLLCTARPRTDCVILTHQKSNMAEWRDTHRLPAPGG